MQNHAGCGASSDAPDHRVAQHVAAAAGEARQVLEQMAEFAVKRPK